MIPLVPHKSGKPLDPEISPDAVAAVEMQEPDAPAVAQLKLKAPRDLRAQKQLGVITALFIGTFLLAVFLPSVQRFSELHERIVTGAQQLQTNRERGRALPELRSRADELQRQLDYFKPLATEREVPAIINDTVIFGTISQLRQFHQQQQEPFVDGPLGIWPIRMTFEGNFENVYSFLRRCEQTPTAMRIAELSIKQKPGAPSQPVQPGEVSASILLHVFYKPEPIASVQ